MTSCVNVWRSVALVFALFLVSRAALAEPYAYQPRQKFTLLGHKGTFGIDGVHSEFSVNDAGLVAFIGDARDRDDANVKINHLLYTDIPGLVTSPGTAVHNITPNISQILAKSFGPAISINNNNEILTRRVSETFGPVTYTDLERWSIDPSGLAATTKKTLDSAHPIIPGLPNAHFHLLTGLCAQNDNRDAGYTAFNTQITSSTSYLATYEEGIIQDSILSAPLVDNTPIPQSIMMSNRNSATGKALMVMRLDGSSEGHCIKTIAAPDFGVVETIAAPANGFVEVGGRPGINRSGGIVVFYGKEKVEDAAKPNPEGIFAYLVPSRKIIRLAGLAGDGRLDPGEYYDDNSDKIPRDGTFEDIGSHQDIGLIRGFFPDTQVVVNNSGWAAFMAQDHALKKCIFFTRVSQSLATQFGGDPYPVIAVGDTVPGLDGQITDLKLSDSLNDRGQPGDLVFWASTSSGDEALLTTRPKHKPVVFLPGIAGSVLGNSVHTFWPTLQSLDLAGINLDPAAESKSIVPVDAVRRAGFATVDVYKPFLDAMRDQGCYREIVPQVSRQLGDTRIYTLPGDAELNTPDLFIFPYDWRISCQDNAGFLAQYLGEIRKLYPETDIDLVCHSMGGLVARRYLAQQAGTHPVDRCVTLCSPFLGAPVAYYRLLTGNFYDNALDSVNRGVMRQILPTFQGVSELIPSPLYFGLQSDSLLVWHSLDPRLSGDLTQPEIHQFLDNLFPTHPVTENLEFHGLPGQDDWSNFDSGIQYLHFVGLQSGDDTPVQTEIFDYPFTNNGSTGPSIEYRTETFVSQRGKGDHTVPFVSAFRAPLGSATSPLWAPQAQAIIVEADAGSVWPGYEDELSEHTGVTQNPRVHRALFYYLRTGNVLWTDGERASLKRKRVLASGTPVDRRELRCIGTSELWITNPQGGVTVPSQPGLQPFYPAGVDFSAGDESAQVWYGGSGSYTFVISGGAKGRFLPLLEVKNSAANGQVLSAVRFQDIVIPAGGQARLIDAGTAPYLLEIDADGTGTFAQNSAPDFEVSGADAADVFPPVVNGQVVQHDGKYFLQLTAEDSGTGVKSLIAQSGQNAPAPYTGEILLGTTAEGSVKAFATDYAGNRSSLFRYPAGAAPQVDRTRSVGTFLGLLPKGFVTLTVAKSGLLTGKVTIDGIAYTVRGKVAADGQVSGLVIRPALGMELSLTLTGDPAMAGNYSLTGSVTPAGREPIAFTAYHTSYGKGQTVAQAGNYTLVLGEADAAGSNPSLGFGYASMIVSRAGKVSLSGKLADGKPLLVSASLVGSASGVRSIVYAPLNYTAVSTRGAKGLLSGSISFASGGSFGGNFAWVKPSQRTGAVPAAIDTTLEIIGSPYAAPGRGGSVLPGFAHGTVELSDEATLSLSDGALRKKVTLTQSAALTVTDAGDDKLKITIFPKTGFFSGSFVYPNQTRATAFSGMLLQNGLYGAGYFLGPEGGGKVILTPAAPAP